MRLPYHWIGSKIEKELATQAIVLSPSGNHLRLETFQVHSLLAHELARGWSSAPVKPSRKLSDFCPLPKKVCWEKCKDTWSVNLRYIWCNGHMPFTWVNNETESENRFSPLLLYCFCCVVCTKTVRQIMMFIGKTNCKGTLLVIDFCL